MSWWKRLDNETNVSHVFFNFHSRSHRGVGRVNVRSLNTIGVLITIVIATHCGGGGGGSQPTPVPVAMPVITAPSAASYLPNTIISVSTQVQTGCAYHWVATNANLINGQGTTAIQLQPAVQTGDPITITLGVTSPTDSKTASAQIQLGAPAVTPIFLQYLAPITAEPNILLSMAVGADPSYTYTWTTTGGAIQSGNGSSSVQILPDAIGNMTITCLATTNIGLTAQSSITVPVLDPTMIPPETPVITGPTQALMAGSTGLVFSTQTQSGCSYQWDLLVRSGPLYPPITMGIVDGAITSGQGTNQVVLNTPKIGGSESCMTVRVIVSKPGQESFSTQPITLIGQ